MPAARSSRVQSLAAVSAVVLTLVLFVVGGRSETGQAIGASNHLAAHLGAYGLIAVAYGYALPRLSWPAVALLVAAIGGLHEYYEIGAHHHPLEWEDVRTNALGALGGALVRPLLDWLLPGAASTGCGR